VTSLNGCPKHQGGAVTEQLAQTHTSACTAPTRNVTTHVPDGFLWEVPLQPFIKPVGYYDVKCENLPKPLVDFKICISAHKVKPQDRCCATPPGACILKVP
jgi:hypothetical protein